MFINYLGVDGGQTSHRLGVIFFGGDAQVVVPLTPLVDNGRRAEMASLIAKPQRMNWTDTGAALELARDALLEDRAGGNQPVVVLLTDGKPERKENPTEAERRAIVEDLERLGQDYADAGFHLFVVQLSNEATDADPEIEAVYVPLWRRLTAVTGGRFYRVRHADDLIDVYHAILVVLSDGQTDGPVVEAALEEETRVEMIAVEPNLVRVTFVVRVGQAGDLPVGTLTDVSVTVHRPDGEVLNPGDGDVRHAAQGSTAIWAVERPRPGQWAVVMVGRGTVTVWKDFLPAPATPLPTSAATSTLVPSPTPSPAPSPTPAPRLDVDGLPEAVLVGQPVTLSASFEPTPPEPLTVWAEWVREDSLPRRERMLDDGRLGDARAGDGRYSTSFRPEGAGILLVRAWGKVAGREIAAWEGRVRVEAHPTLQLVAPEAGDRWQAGRPGGVRVQWIAGDEPLATGGLMTVTLCPLDGEVRDACSTVVTGTVGRSLSMDAPQEAGTYSLTVRATGCTAAGVSFQGRCATTVAVHRPLPAWIWIASVGSLLAGTGGWLAYRYFRRLPRLVGHLRVLGAPAGYAGPTEIDLSLLDRRSARVGGAEAELPIPTSGAPWAIIRALSDASGMELAPGDGWDVRVNDVPLTGSHLLSDRDLVTASTADAPDIRLRYEHLRV
jgi:hypothetical protein